jgi:dynein heavy chain
MRNYVTACRERLRQFPSLVNCCTIDWFTSWRQDALEAVAQKFLADVDGIDSNTRRNVIEMCKSFHEDASALSARYKTVVGRVNYVTPTSYLELLTMFTSLLAQQRSVLGLQQKRYKVRFCNVVPSSLYLAEGSVRHSNRVRCTWCES